MCNVLNAETIVSIGLVVGLVISIFWGTNELSMSIASGLIGYIGRGKLTEPKKEEKAE
mgnify:CR=1 FL=1